MGNAAGYQEVASYAERVERVLFAARQPAANAGSVR
ncbi:MAG: hypothetical protein JWN04_3278 [Myxococcaceae bacterium]|nr:hypothetical protein [Myxococcaceae bacterium]